MWKLMPRPTNNSECLGPLETVNPLAFPYIAILGTQGLALSRGPTCHVVDYPHSPLRANSTPSYDRFISTESRSKATVLAFVRVVGCRRYRP